MGTIEVKDDIFLERKAELSIFDRFISSSDEDKTKMLLISGERGIGKTHLLKNIGPEIEKKGFVYLQGKCYDTNSDPYLPLREAFDQYENKTEEVEEDGLIFSNILAEEPIRKDLKIFDREKRTIFYQSVKEIKKIVKEIPIFISLDDLHWSDELTLKMLHYLSLKLRKEDILFSGAYDDNEMQKNPAFKNFLFNMQQDGLIDVIELNPLNLEGTKSLIDHIISIDDVPDRFVKIVHVKSCGNPLFIKEMACHLLNQEGDDFSIPPSLSGVIEHRFEDLSGRSKHLMEVGAVIGEKVDFDIVEAVIDIEESELLDEIDILLEKKLWKEDEDGTLRFAHPLFREVVYRSISGLKRKKYHEKIAEAIKSVRDDVIYRYYLDIALHYERAGIFSSAFLNYEKAGIDAEKLGAYRVASDCYDRALKLDLSLRSEEFRKEKERVSTSKEELKRLIEHQ